MLRRRSGGPRVELVCVGTELLMGKLNSHGAFVSSVLEEAGHPLIRETTVSDDPVEMESVFREVWARSDVVIVTGGLGPTFDDQTREVWATVCGRPLVFHPALMAAIVDRFRRRGTPMPPANRRQAYLLRGARAIENPNGTAPGQWVDLGKKIVVLLPGPGREMKPMLEREVVPTLKKRFPSEFRRTRVWRLFGVPESAVDQRLRSLMTAKGGLTWGILAQDGGVDVKMTVSDSDEARGEKALARWDDVMRRRFKSDIFGKDGETLESVVGGLLRQRGKTLAVVESCTGGGLAQKITAVPGSSDYFWGGVVAYANAAKSAVVGVGHKTLRAFGAVSEPVAREMADAFRKKVKTDFVLSITGVAGPGGGTGEKPVGSVFIGCSGPNGTRVQEMRLLGDRNLIRSQATLWALNLLRKELMKGKRPLSRAKGQA